MNRARSQSFELMDTRQLEINRYVGRRTDERLCPEIKVCLSWSAHTSMRHPSHLLGEQVVDAAMPMPGAVAAVSKHASGLGDGALLAALLLSNAGRRTLLPVCVEVLPFLCSFAQLLRHTLDERIEVVVDVDRECPAWRVDRGALEDALMQVVLGSDCAVRRMGRLTLQASLDRRTSPQGTVLKVFSSSPVENVSSFEWRN